MRVAVSNPNQFNMTLGPKLRGRLKELAREFHDDFEFATEVGANIIETYVEHWAQRQERIREGKKQVEQAEEDALANLGRPPLVTGEANQASPTAGRKKKP